MTHQTTVLLTSLAAGMLSGAAIMTSVTRFLQFTSGTLLSGLIVSVIVASSVTWYFTRGVRTGPRVAVTVLALAGMGMLAGLTIPMDLFLGPGLTALYPLILAGAAGLMLYQASRLSRESSAPAPSSPR
jgi:hypothetical protein